VAALPAQTGGASPQASTVPLKAPMNPRFVEHWNTRTQGQAFSMVAQPGHALGLIPSTIDLSHLKTSQGRALQSSTPLPSSYDLRTSGRVTPVEDQGQCAVCWSFATFGSLESALAPGEVRAFSENNLKDLHGFDGQACGTGVNPTSCGACSGGNWQMSAAYLARWAGPVNASDDPYQATNTDSSPNGMPAQKHLQDVFIFPPRSGPLDNDVLKNAVMTYGGLYTSMHMDESAGYLNYSSGAYYYYGAASGQNHAVTLVGWDDSYSAAHFPTTPAGDGAFLIKNSWGTSFGQRGYFWISYYDTQYLTSESVAFFVNEPPTNYDRLYEYDPLGWVANYGYGSNTAWFANIFTAVDNENLKAVSTYVNANASPYSVSIYTGVIDLPTSGALAATTSGTFALAGYNTLVLPVSVALTAGQRFSVVMELTTPGYGYPVPAEVAETHYSSQATANPGQSYMSSDGVSWSDTTTIVSTMNVALKAFASAIALPAIASLSPSSTAAGGTGFTLTINGSNFVSGATAQWGSTALATTFINTNRLTAWVPANLIATVGTASVTVITSDGTSAPATFNITAPPPHITSLSPGSTAAGGAALTLTVNGTNFLSGATINWNGAPLTTQFLSATQLSATIPANLIATAGSASVTVATTIGTSSVAYFTINPAAQTINFLNPGTQTYGAVPLTLIATASSGLTVSFTVTSGPAAVNGTKLTITGAGAVTVQAAQPGNSTYSAAAPVSVSFTANPAPLTATANNASAVFGAPMPALTGTLTGAIAGDGITASYSTPALQGSATGTHPITPSLNDPNTRLSNYRVKIANGSLTIYSPSQDLTLWLSPASATAGGASFTLTVSGTNFASNSLVLWNGAVRATNYFGSTQLTATILAPDIAKEATNLVTVANFAPNPGTTSALPFAVVSSTPVAAISAVSISTAADGSGNHLLSLTGADFDPASTVLWNGANLTTNYIGPWQITATITAADYTTRPAALMVNNPATASSAFELQ
jgi:C1A family cysteine protease